MSSEPEYIQRLCIDGPREGTFVRMKSHRVGSVITFPNKVQYQLQEDGTLQHMEGEDTDAKTS